MKKLLTILFLFAFFAANSQPFTNINQNETGLSSRTKINNVFEYLNELGLKLQFSADGNLWGYPYTTGDKYIRYSANYGTSWSPGFFLWGGDNIITLQLDTLQIGGQTITGGIVTLSDSTFTFVTPHQLDSTLNTFTPSEVAQTLTGSGTTVPKITLSDIDSEGGGTITFIGAGSTTLSHSNDTITISSTGGEDPGDAIWSRVSSRIYPVEVTDEVSIGSPTDYGDYKFQVDGSSVFRLRNSGDFRAVDFITASSATTPYYRLSADGTNGMLLAKWSGSSYNSLMSFPYSSNYVGLAGGLLLSNTTDATAGLIRWDGTNFQGYSGTAWVNLDQAGGGSSQWTDDTYGITYSSANVGIGVTSSQFSRLAVEFNSASNYAATVYNSNATGFALRARSAAVSATVPIFSVTQGTSTDVFRVNGSGNIRIIRQSSDPSSPASAYGHLYAKSDGSVDRLYFQNSLGTIYDLTAGGGGLTDPMTTRGDITARLGRGTAGQMLTSDGTDISWTTPAFAKSGSNVTLSTSNDLVGIGASPVSGKKLSVTGASLYTAVYGSTTNAGYYGVEGVNSANSGTAGFFSATGAVAAVGVSGQVSSSGGLYSAGVRGVNLSTSTSEHYGGEFSAMYGSNGIGVYGYASGTGSIGMSGIGTGTGSIGVKGYGDAYDFYAAGPGTDYGSASSGRWKQNILPIPDALGKINSLRGVYFDWIPERGGKHDIGFIAEEIHAVLPEITVTGTDGQIDGLDYSKITPLLLQAIKELSAKVDQLSIKVDQLEKRVYELEKR